MRKNIFNDLRSNSSSLLTLFENQNEILNIAAQAPSPSKNYYQLLMTNKHITLRWWEISRRASMDSRYPGEKKLTYDEFLEDDELIQRKLHKVLKVLNKYFLRVVIQFSSICKALRQR